jgi:hypothetical protein
MCARIAVDMNLFDLILKNDGPVNALQLATLSGGEKLLVGQSFPIQSLSEKSLMGLKSGCCVP